jgi:hypothetical protein
MDRTTAWSLFGTLLKVSASGRNVWLVGPLTCWRRDIIIGNGLVDLITANDSERTAIYVEGGCK